MAVFNDGIALHRAYAELQRAVEREGLLAKTPGYYLWQTVLSFSIVASGFGLLWAYDHLAVQIAAILILSIGFVQASLVGHDIAHRQVFRSHRLLNIFGVLFWNLILGASFRYWTEKHDRHHANPNQIGKDPDLGAPFLFSEEQSRRASRLRKWFTKYQKTYFFFALALAYFSVAGHSVRYLARQQISPAIAAEWLFLALHFAAYFAFLGSILPLDRLIALTALHYASMGIYLGLIFAPNHKGLRIFRDDESYPHAYRQVISSRNIRPHPLVDYLYGGLNYQIEHHLFPIMPRAHLKRARELVRIFCEREALPYHEVGTVGAFREIYQSFVPAHRPQ